MMVKNGIKIQKILKIEKKNFKWVDKYVFFCFISFLIFYLIVIKSII